MFQNINLAHKHVATIKKNAKILIEGEDLTAFHNAKKAFADFTKLSYICNDNTATLSLTTDASGNSIGAVLQQKQNGLEKPISFFLVKLNTAQLTANNNSRTWLEKLPLALLSIRNVIKEDLGCTASEMIFGTLPGQFCEKTFPYNLQQRL